MSSSTVKSKAKFGPKSRPQFRSTPASSAGSTPRPSSPLPTQTPSISHPAHTLLSRSHPAVAAATIFTDKIKNKPLLLNPSHLSSTTNVILPPGSSQAQSSATATTNSRALRRHIRDHKNRYARQKKAKRAGHRALSAKEKRQLDVYALPDPASDVIMYEVYEGLNRMWTGYVREVLGFPPLTSPAGALDSSTAQSGTYSSVNVSTNKNNTNTNSNANNNTNTNTSAKPKIITPTSHGSLLASLDFHGMNIEVTRSKDPGKVGLKGIIVRESLGLFVVVVKITNQNQNPNQNYSTPDNSNSNPNPNTTKIPPVKGERSTGRLVKIHKRGSIFRVVVDLSSPSSSPAQAACLPLDSSHHQSQDQYQDQPTATKEKAKENVAPRLLTFELHGSQLERRPIDRAVKQFKWTRMEGL